MLKRLLFFGFVIFAFSSCCKKTACLENHDMPIMFYGFTKAEVDTIYSTGYNIGSEFSEIARAEEIDTAANIYGYPENIFSLSMRENRATYGFGWSHTAYDKYEWKIFIPAVNKTVLIHNYGYNSYRCNGCGFRRGNKVASLSTCSVNDSIKYVDDIRIYK